MKNRTFLFTLLLSLFIISSCSKDDENTGGSAPIQTNTNKGKLIVNGVEKSVNKGFIIPNYTGNDTNYNKRRFYFILTNGDVTLQNNDFVYSDNITQLIDFNMFCSSTNLGSIQNTIYNLNNTHTSVNSNNAYIDHSGINTNVVIQNGNHVSSDTLDSDEMTSGQANVSVNNGIYTISFSFSNAGNTISGTYTGTMTTLNYQY